MSLPWPDQLDLLIRSRTPILWIRSLEEERIDSLLQQAAQRLGGRSLWRWDFIDGLAGAPKGEGFWSSVTSTATATIPACAAGCATWR